jgi:hypothetical protein
MKRETFHCLCGFASDKPGMCPNEPCRGDHLHSKLKGWRK